LRGAAFEAGGRKGVHAVFEHVEKEGAEVDDGEFIDGLIDAMELEGLVPGEDVFRSVRGCGPACIGPGAEGRPRGRDLGGARSR